MRAGGTERPAAGPVSANDEVAAGLVRPADSSCAAPLLRFLVVWRRDGLEGAAGVAGASVALDDIGVYPRPQRPHRAGVEEGKPTDSDPLRRRGVSSCGGICE